MAHNLIRTGKRVRLNLAIRGKFPIRIDLRNLDD